MLHSLKCGMLEGPFYFDTNQAERPARLLVLLHGWGADGRDLADLGGPLQQMMPDLGLWCPHAPAACTANPMGRQWFELTERFFSRPEEALDEMTEIVSIIEGAIEALVQEKELAIQDVVIGGFSQGGMMALHLATQSHLPAAGFASLSGALVGEANPISDSAQSIFLAHGKSDEVVPFAASREAQSSLEEAGHRVDFLARDGLGHGIDMAVLEALGHFTHNVTATQ